MPELCQTSPSEIEGRREYRMLTAPAAGQQTRKLAAVTKVQPEQPAFPRDGFNQTC
jgi:hypothetical protein